MNDSVTRPLHGPATWLQAEWRQTRDEAREMKELLPELARNPVLIGLLVILATILVLLFVVGNGGRGPDETYGGTPLSTDDWIIAQRTGQGVDGGSNRVFATDQLSGDRQQVAEILLMRDRKADDVFYARFWNSTGVEAPMSISLTEYRTGADRRRETHTLSTVTATGPDLVAYATGRVRPGWCVMASYATSAGTGSAPVPGELVPREATCVS